MTTEENVELIKFYPKRNGKVCETYCFKLPKGLDKKESREEAIEWCKERNLLYSMVDGTPRAIANCGEIIRGLISFCTSVTPLGGSNAHFKKINGQSYPLKAKRGGGINYTD